MRACLSLLKLFRDLTVRTSISCSKRNFCFRYSIMYTCSTTERVSAILWKFEEKKSQCGTRRALWKRARPPTLLLPRGKTVTSMCAPQESPEFRETRSETSSLYTRDAGLLALPGVYMHITLYSLCCVLLKEEVGQRNSLISQCAIRKETRVGSACARTWEAIYLIGGSKRARYFFLSCWFYDLLSLWLVRFE